MINLPMVSYYQIGTHLTANHAHAAFVGVYLMLALALLVFALRYLVRPEDWSDRMVGFSFWTLNLGLAWMVFVNLLPPLGCSSLGIQWRTGTGTRGSIEFFREHAVMEWLRMPGDVLFIAGVVPIVYMTARSSSDRGRSPHQLRIRWERHCSLRSCLGPDRPNPWEARHERGGAYSPNRSTWKCGCSSDTPRQSWPGRRSLNRWLRCTSPEHAGSPRRGSRTILTRTITSAPKGNGSHLTCSTKTNG